MQTPEDARRVLRWLVIVRLVAVADAVLLVVLLAASFADNEELVSIFGLTHGLVFILLIAVIGLGALRRMWSWWFLVATIVTTGPPGALVGEVLVARRARVVLEGAGTR